MPRYYFNIQDGRSEPDTDGTELSDEVVARREAIRFAGQIMDDDAHRIALGERWQLDVTDERGSTLFRLDVHVSRPEPQAPISVGRTDPRPELALAAPNQQKPD